MKFQIQEVKSDDDIRFVADLAKSIWTEYFVPIIGAPQTEYMIHKFQTFDKIKESIFKSNNNYFAVSHFEKKTNPSDSNNTESENPFLAYLALTPDERGVFLSRIYVKKEARNQGIAKMLIDFALNLTREEIQKNEKFSNENRPCLWLTVNKKNMNSIDFYKKRGFVIENERKLDIGNGFYMDDYLMALYLDCKIK